MSSRIAIFTLTYNRLELTKRMLGSLEKTVDLPYDHLVVDNGSTDGTVDYLKSKPYNIVKTVFNSTNKGLSIGWNQAIEILHSDYDFVVKVDNDCELMTKGWLNVLLEVADAAGEPMILSPYIDGLSPRYAGGFRRYENVSIGGHDVGLTKHLGGICLFVPSQAYGRFRFPENIPLHGNQDARFSAYVNNELGFKLGYVEDVVAAHMPEQNVKFPKYFENRKLEKVTVYNEPKFKTAMLRPMRRYIYYRSLRKAGIGKTTLPKLVLRRIRRCGDSFIDIIKKKRGNGSVDFEK